MRFCDSDRFEEMCIWSNWDSGWVMDTFRALNDVHPSVRLSIGKECVHMLKVLAVIDCVEEDSDQPPLNTLNNMSW